jgi:hypothetical protein
MEICLTSVLAAQSKIAIAAQQYFPQIDNLLRATGGELP